MIIVGAHIRLLSVNDEIYIEEIKLFMTKNFHI